MFDISYICQLDTEQYIHRDISRQVGRYVCRYYDTHNFVDALLFLTPIKHISNRDKCCVDSGLGYGEGRPKRSSLKNSAWRGEELHRCGVEEMVVWSQ